jgi:hypothetical protein
MPSQHAFTLNIRKGTATPFFKASVFSHISHLLLGGWCTSKDQLVGKEKRKGKSPLRGALFALLQPIYIKSKARRPPLKKGESKTPPYYGIALLLVFVMLSFSYAELSEWLKNRKVKKAYDEMSLALSIAHKLISAKLKSHLTQKEVAERMGTTQSVVARIESGNRL